MALMLAVLSCTVASAQIYTYKSYAYAQKKPGYAWSNFVSSDLTITINFNTDVIKIYNKLGSTFRIYNTYTQTDNDGETQLHCDALDEENLRCKVRLVVRNSGTSQIYIDYNDITWCYNVRRIN